MNNNVKLNLAEICKALSVDREWYRAYISPFVAKTNGQIGELDLAMFLSERVTRVVRERQMVPIAVLLKEPAAFAEENAAELAEMDNDSKIHLVKKHPELLSDFGRRLLETATHAAEREVYQLAGSTNLDKYTKETVANSVVLLMGGVCKVYDDSEEQALLDHSYLKIEVDYKSKTGESAPKSYYYLDEPANLFNLGYINVPFSFYKQDEIVAGVKKIYDKINEDHSEALDVVEKIVKAQEEASTKF